MKLQGKLNQTIVISSWPQVHACMLQMRGYFTQILKDIIAWSFKSLLYLFYIVFETFPLVLKVSNSISSKLFRSGGRALCRKLIKCITSLSNRHMNNEIRPSQRKIKHNETFWWNEKLILNCHANVAPESILTSLDGFIFRVCIVC